MLPLRCRAVLLDLDGVLVDSTLSVERTWRRWAARHGLDAATVLGVAHGRRTIETVRLAAPHLRLDIEVAALAAEELAELSTVTAIAGGRALLDMLPAGRWAIVTSGTRAIAEARLQHTDLPVPPVLVAAEDVVHGKPAPEGYLAAAARLRMSPGDCVVIEDAPPGLAAARAAGMRTVAVPTTHRGAELAEADLLVPTLQALRVRATGDALLIESTR